MLILLLLLLLVLLLLLLLVVVVLLLLLMRRSVHDTLRRQVVVRWIPEPRPNVGVVALF
jgi:hypothetical protein